MDTNAIGLAAGQMLSISLLIELVKNLRTAILQFQSLRYFSHLSRTFPNRPQSANSKGALHEQKTPYLAEFTERFFELCRERKTGTKSQVYLRNGWRLLKKNEYPQNTDSNLENADFSGRPRCLPTNARLSKKRVELLTPLLPNLRPPSWR